MKCCRQRDATLLANVSEFERKWRQLEDFKVVLPDDLRGWLLLRRSGISTEQRTLIMGNLGKDLSLAFVTTALYFSFGQDSLPHRHYKHGHAYLGVTADQDDDDDVDDFFDYDDHGDDAFDDADGYFDEYDATHEGIDTYDSASYEDTPAETYDVDEYENCYPTTSRLANK